MLEGLILFYFWVLEEEEAVPRTSFLHPAGWQELVLERRRAGRLGRSQSKALLLPGTLRAPAGDVTHDRPWAKRASLF